MTEDRMDFGLAYLAADVVDVDLEKLQEETNDQTELAQRLLSEFSQSSLNRTDTRR